MISVGDSKIARGEAPFVVAEIGINHCGNMELAKRMIESCAKAGASAVKHQCHIPEAEMVRSHPWWDTVSRCSLSESQEREVFACARDLGVLCFSTPFSVAAVARLEALGVPLYKIGSGEVSHRPLLAAVAATGKPVLMSTGMHSRAEIKAAWRTLRPGGCGMLHCVSKYPTDYVDAGLRELRRGGYVGLSDHTPTIYTSLAAVALGACVIEKHVKPAGARCPDERVSLYLDEVPALVQGCRAVWLACRDVEVNDRGLRAIAEHRAENGWKRAGDGGRPMDE